MFQLILKAYQEVAVMYALGHKQTCAAQKVMSALPPKADMCGPKSDVRFVPIANIAGLIRSPRRRATEMIPGPSG